MKRRIGYVTGTRADFGLMERTLVRIHRHPSLDLGLFVTGMHLSAASGMTAEEVAKSGLPVLARIAVDLEAGTGAAMAEALARELSGLVRAFLHHRPDIVLLLGDRAEMLAGALAAIHLNIPVAHLHGGERSGTVDEPVRHAISKLSHYHFTATLAARERLARMGENQDHIFVTGAPGLDGLTDERPTDRHSLCTHVGFDASRPVALVLYHPVLQTEATAGAEMAEVLTAIDIPDVQILCFHPNADAGNRLVRAEIGRWCHRPGFRACIHLPREQFIGWLAAADVLVGNSSSGIIEAASFGLPVVNVGPRQHARERNLNTVDVPVERGAISLALHNALARGRYPCENVYGDGKAGEKIASLLSTLPTSGDLLCKHNAY